MSNERRETADVRSPLATLERAFIEEYIRRRGYDPLELAALPDETRDALLRDASVYASAKLTEVESRSHFLDEIHDGKTD
jgi:hypothetical protein